MVFRNLWAVADVDYDAELPAFLQLFGENSDRPVSQRWEERPPITVMGADMVGRMDVDKDGRLTRDEFLGFWMGRFDSQDKDGSGQLSAAEFPAAEAFKGGDANGDGLLTRDEYRSVYAPQFDGLDTDDDDVITGWDRR